MNQLPIDILYLIASFIVVPQYKLRTDIENVETLLHKEGIYKNPRAFRFLLKQYPSTSLPWDICCRNGNEDALLNLFEQPRYIHYPTLCMNNNDIAVQYLLTHEKKIDWKYACFNSNPRMVELLLLQLEKITWNPKDVEWWKNWHRMALNTNEKITVYFTSNPDTIPIFFPLLWKNSNEKLLEYLWVNYHKQINWVFLSKNTSDLAMDLLFSHPTLIDWISANENPNPKMVSYLINHPELILPEFCKNKNPIALEYILVHPNLIHWVYLSEHPFLFCIDQKATWVEIKKWTRNVLY